MQQLQSAQAAKGVVTHRLVGCTEVSWLFLSLELTMAAWQSAAAHKCVSQPAGATRPKFCVRVMCMCSSGNHAAALALAAKLQGIPAHIVVPRDAPACKLAAVKEYGGENTH